MPHSPLFPLATPHFISRRVQQKSFTVGKTIRMTQSLDVPGGVGRFLLITVINNEENGADPGSNPQGFPYFNGVKMDFVLSVPLNPSFNRGNVFQFKTQDQGLLIPFALSTITFPDGQTLDAGEVHNMVVFFDMFTDINTAKSPPFGASTTKQSNGTPMIGNVHNEAFVRNVLIVDFIGARVGAGPLTSTDIGIDLLTTETNTGAGSAPDHMIFGGKIYLATDPSILASLTPTYDGTTGPNDDWVIISKGLLGRIILPEEDPELEPPPEPAPQPPKAEISPEFNSLQSRQTVEPRQRLLAVLQNTAAQTEGGVATASGSDPSGNFPPEGANDGDATPLNVGAAATAENGVGKASWKSGDASITNVITTKADFLDKDYDVVASADTPTAYWRLGEGSGPTAFDKTAGNHDGTYTNGPTLGVVGLIDEPDPDTAVTFNGSTQYVTVPDDPAWDFTDLTMEAWVIYTG